MRKMGWGWGLCALICFCCASGFCGDPTKEVHGKGLVRDPRAFKAFLKTAKREKKVFTAALPAFGDLSPIGALPRNQGSCGSCWAYALTKSLESEYLINGLKPPSLLDVSYLIGNCGGPVKMWGCNGGDFPAGQNFLNGLGPWGGGVDPANGACKRLPAIATAESFVMLGDGNAPPSDQEMVQAMFDKHVLTIDVAADRSWSSYSGGVRTQSTSNGINHMINRLAWHCPKTNPDGSCFFDAKGISPGIEYLDMNNWGENWGTKAANGHGGYIWETRLVNQSGQAAAYFTIKHPDPPPVPPVPPSGNLPTWAMFLLGLLGLAVVFLGLALSQRKKGIIHG